MNKDDLRLSHILVKWYTINKRELPWRNTTDPYKIWLSEVILQQTRVDQGYAYYMRFTEEFPTIQSLADAEEDQVLKLWQGLGYYSRARNLHYTAKLIQSTYDGKFPESHKAILSLKGIGEYTAAAITSFAYNQPYAAVDGNVYRVLSRIYGIADPIDSTIGKKTFANLADSILDRENPGTHNQAMMEFGALQCVPSSPNCSICPASDMCYAYAENKISSLPVKQGKTKVRTRYFNYFDIRHESCTYLTKRTGSDIWKNLYELPLIETDKELIFDEIQANPDFKTLFGDRHLEVKAMQSKVKHVLSHQIIFANFYRIETNEKLDAPDLFEIPLKDVSNYAISRLVDRYFELTLHT